MPGSDILDAIAETSDTDELRRILAAADSRLAEVIGQERKAVSRKIAELAAAAGRQSQPKKYPPTTRPPKYRNPADPEETWHGRGPPPEWLKQLEDAGRKREEFLIGS